MMDRRRFLKNVLCGAVSVGALPLMSVSALGQPSWPVQNLVMIVPFPPGGQADLAARPMAAAMEKLLGRSVVVENRAGGAGGSIGTVVAARGAPMAIPC